MFAAYLFLLVISLGLIWAGLRTTEEVHRLALTSTGLISLVWGFALTPEPIQLSVEVLLVGLYKFFAPRPKR